MMEVRGSPDAEAGTLLGPFDSVPACLLVDAIEVESNR